MAAIGLVPDLTREVEAASIDFLATEIRASDVGTDFQLELGDGVSRSVRIPLFGNFNVENALAALAAVLMGELDITGKTVVVVASGGNVDPDVFGLALQQGGDG